MRLLRTQKNQLFDAITNSGLPNSRFTMSEREGSTGIVNRVVCDQENYHFEIRDGWLAPFMLSLSPAMTSNEESYQANEWSEVLSTFSVWLNCVKREATAPDKWKKLSEGLPLQQVHDNVPFTVAERNELSERIALLKQGVTGLPITPEQVLAIEHKLDYLTDQMTVLTKVNWLDLFIGAMVSLILQLSIPQEAAGMLWELVRSAFAQYLIQQ